VKRRILAVFGAALLILVTATAAAAAAPNSAFTGLWVSTDTDGSTQLLKVSGGTTPSVLYQDFYASVCANNGSRSVHWTASGTGTVDGDALFASFKTSGCGSFGIGAYESPWFYDGATDTLTDPYDVTWYRVP